MKNLEIIFSGGVSTASERLLKYRLLQPGSVNNLVAMLPGKNNTYFLLHEAVQSLNSKSVVRLFAQNSG